MNRLLATLAALLLLLVLGEGALRRSQFKAREEAGQLRLLAPVSAGNIAQIAIGVGRRQWQFVREDSTWRFPAYHHAFALDRRVEQLLKSLSEVPATFVSAELGDLPRYGLGPGSLRISLLDAADRPLLEVLQGRGAPSPRAGESYVQRIGADTIFHLHAHPLHALDNNDPPLLDRRVLPRALPRQAIQKIAFAGNNTYPLQSLHRVLQELDPSAGLPQGSSYDWIATYPAGEKACNAQSVYAYVDFLQRLTWSALHPADTKAFADARYVYIEDEGGRIDTLEVGTAKQQGQYLRLRTTGHVATVATAKAALLFPTTAALTDTLPDPGPYRQIEPFSPF